MDATRQLISKPNRRLHALAVAALLVAMFLLFLPATRYGWVGDDPVQIVSNPRITSVSYLPSYFTKHLWYHVAEHAKANYYRPFFLMWLLANFKLFGTSPAGWHLTSIIAHLAATWFLYRMVRELTPSYWIAWITTAIFALHAVHLESVAYVSGVCDPMMARGIFAGLYWFLRYRRNGRPRQWLWLVLSAFACAVAMLSKEPGAVFPFLAIVVAMILGVQLRGRDGFALSVYTLLLSIYLMIRLEVLDAISYTITPLPLSVQLLTAPSVLWLYFSKLLLPLDLSYTYDLPYIASPWTGMFWFPLFSISGFAAILWLLWLSLRAHRRLIAVGTALLVIPLLPALRFSNMFWSEIAHDRYLYVSVAGFALIVAAALDAVRLRWKRVAIGAFAVWMIVITALTAAQLPHWRDRLTLYANAARLAPRSAPALFAYATELSETGNKEASIPYFRRGLGVNPNNWGGNFNLGAALFDLHRYSEAEAAFTQASRVNPYNALSQYQIAMCHLALGDLQGAEMPLRRASELEPNAPNVHFTLATVLEKRGMLGAAKDEYREELRVNPANATAQEHLKILAESPARATRK